MQRFLLFFLIVCGVAKSQTLTSIPSFGTNPGNLSMYTYNPSGIVGPAPIVVVLHGCTQTAQQAADQTGWNKLADTNKFYVIYPEQTVFNNGNRCFNWFLSGDQEKGQGENLSIKQMVDYMKNNFTIDNSKVFVTGLSAGAAMTEIACATYPEIYAGGAVLAGGPYKFATSVFDAASAMNGMVDKTPTEWSTLVFAQNPGYTGTFPKMAFFHGTSDAVVNINNLTESIEQWTAVHQIDQAIDATVINYAGNPDVSMHSYRNNLNQELVASYIVSGFGHAIPIDVGACPQQGGQTATYAIDINFHSTWHAAHFFGLVDTVTSTLLINGPNSVANNQNSVVYSVILNATSSYNWSVPTAASIASGQGSNSVNVNFVTNSGLISVYETTSAGCLNGPESLWVNVSGTVGLLNSSGINCAVFYNEEIRQIEISGIKQKNTLRLLDINGKLILSQESADENVSLQLPESISEGVYIIEISNGTNLINKKIIIR
jgi:poly(hydroxyalkanoate) depolymerase family esterase